MAVNCVITWILKEKKTTKRSLFFHLNFNYVYTNVDKIERARAREKTKGTNFVERTTWKLYSVGEKVRNVSDQQSENERQWRKKRTGTRAIKFFCENLLHKTCCVVCLNTIKFYTWPFFCKKAQGLLAYYHLILSKDLKGVFTVVSSLFF